jgi:hypothetical protein
MLTPYDLGNFSVTENCQKIKVDQLVNQVQKELKKRLLEAQISTFGIDISFTTTKTKFNGERIWFICPNCKKRVGDIYKHPMEDKVGCRVCLNLKYKKQRFKGMIETAI